MKVFFWAMVGFEISLMIVAMVTITFQPIIMILQFVLGAAIFHFLGFKKLVIYESLLNLCGVLLAIAEGGLGTFIFPYQIIRSNQELQPLIFWIIIAFPIAFGAQIVSILLFHWWLTQKRFWRRIGIIKTHQ